LLQRGPCARAGAFQERDGASAQCWIGRLQNRAEQVDQLFTFPTRVLGNFDHVHILALRAQLQQHRRDVAPIHVKAAERAEDCAPQ